MSDNAIGLILSFAFVFFMIFAATLLQKLFKMSNEFSRKIIHIGVGHWVFISLYFFRDWYIAIIGPVAFIIMNYISYNHNIFKAMELEEKNPGTIYYPISLTICTFFTYSKPHMLVLPFLGIMALAWGDGLAAVIGKKWPIKVLRANRTIGGTTSFVLVTLIASIVYLLLIAKTMPMSQILLFSLLTAVLGAIIELFSPKNTDNLTVPIILGLAGFLVGI